MQSLFIELDEGRAGHEQLFEALRDRIQRGKLRPGDRLPPTRALAEAIGLTRGIIVAAYRQLLAEGYVHARVGAGTWVSDPPPDALLPVPLPPPDGRGPGSPTRPRLSSLARYALIANLADEDARRGRRRPDGITFSLESALQDDRSIEAWRQVVRRRLQPSSRANGSAEDSRALPRALAAYLRRSRGICVDPDQILILTGVQQGLDLVARALLQSGSGVLIEDPCYRGARVAFEAHGARLIGCPVDGDGIVIGEAARGRPRLRQVAPPPARLAFVTPSHQYPTGAVMSLARRLELLAWASTVDAVVVELDYEGELRFEGRPLPALFALDGEARGIYLGTFSRTLYPDLRVGYAVLPRSLVEPLAALMRLADGLTPVALQSALADFIVSGQYERHLRRLRQRIRRRRDALLTCLEQHLGNAVEVTGAAAGLQLAVWFEALGPDAEGTLLANTRELRVGVTPVSACCLTPPSRLGLLLGYGRLREAEIERGVRRLAMAWRATLSATAAVPATGRSAPDQLRPGAASRARSTG